MSQAFSTGARRSVCVLGVVLAIAGAACAQPTPAPSPPQQQQGTPNAETPPGGIPRGLVSPPRGVDPGMVEPPPANVKPNMPVIKPPGTAR